MSVYHNISIFVASCDKISHPSMDHSGDRATPRRRGAHRPTAAKGLTDSVPTRCQVKPATRFASCANALKSKARSRHNHPRIQALSVRLPQDIEETAAMCVSKAGKPLAQRQGSRITFKRLHSLLQHDAHTDWKRAGVTRHTFGANLVFLCRLADGNNLLGAQFGDFVQRIEL